MEFWLGIGMLITLFVGGMIFLYRYEMSKIEIVPLSDDERQALDWAIECMKRPDCKAPAAYVEIVEEWARDIEDGE